MCGGCGGGHAFTICMFSLTAEYKRTNSSDERHYADARDMIRHLIRS